jgi:hypothetical protein
MMKDAVGRAMAHEGAWRTGDHWDGEMDATVCLLLLKGGSVLPPVLGEVVGADNNVPSK